MTLTHHRTLQYIGILLALAALATGYWYFSVRASTKLQSSQAGSLTNGLVGQWSMDGQDVNWSDTYEVKDTSGNANDGDSVNMSTASVVPGRIGQALTFDGVNQQISIGTVAAFGNQATRTISTWIKPSGLTTYRGIVGAGVGSFQICSNDGTDCPGTTGRLVYYHTFSGTDGKWILGADSVKANEWAHVVVTYDRSSTSNDPQIYVNGVSQSVTELTTPTGTADSEVSFNVSIGYDGYVYAMGAIDDVRIYNRALSATEVASLYDMGKVTINTRPGDDPLEEGLAGYWKLDENTGTNAADASGNGNAGTLTNGPTWTTGRIGSAVTFDGTDDSINIPDSPLWDYNPGTQARTFSAWVNFDTLPASVQPIAGADGVLGAYTFYVYGTGMYLFDGSGGVSAGDAHLVTGSWTLLTWVIQGGTLTCYRDGSVVGSASGVANANQLPSGFFLGWDGYSAGFADGKIDEARFYNRALSADEVSQLYRLTTPTGVDTSLKGYWSFNGSDTTGTTAYDRSGAGNNGTLTNGPTITEGKLGQALSLDGSNDYVSVTDPGTSSALDFANGNSITLSTWVKPDAFDGTWGSIVGKETSNSIYSPNYAILHSNSCSGSSPCPLMFYYDSGSCNETAQQMFVTSGNVLTPGVWQFITVIYTFGTGSTVKVYVDGNEKSGSWTSGNGNVAPCQGNEPFRIGIDYDGDMFDGQIDETRIYNRALSANEVKSLYDLGA
ncbi:MAG: LamG domain-containing protein, partial [Candidatus Moraniibacteriota bacterium]